MRWRGREWRRGCDGGLGRVEEEQGRGEQRKTDRQRGTKENQM